MSVNLRRLGVYGENLPVKEARVVEPSDFLIGGLFGKTERTYDKSYVVRNITEYQEIFGYHITSGNYMYDAVQGFFNNTTGVDAKLYCVGHVGYTAGAIDGVTASQAVPDGTPETVLTIKDAYLNELGYGISGNRTGITVTNGVRHTGAIRTASTKDDLFIVVDQPAKYRVGDIIKVVATEGGGATVYKKVTSIDESAYKVFFVAAFDGAANPGVDDVVTILGFRLRIWRKDNNGIVNEVDTELGKTWCTTESECTDFYVTNVFNENSKWVQVTRDTTTPATLDLNFPVDIATVTYNASGAVGTLPTTAAQWANDVDKFANDDIRFLACPETVDETIQISFETLMRARNDTPKVIFNSRQDRTKAQLEADGGLYQRSDDVLGTIVAGWLEVDDPFNTSATAPPRAVPNVGHVMGVIIRAIGLKGIHYIPQKDTPIFGIIGVDNDNIEDITDVDRTDLAESGMNIIQNVKGYGNIIRNMFTPSITTAYQFLNGIVMRDYVKISAVDSLQGSENQPNSFGRIKNDRSAILTFLYNLWNRGSTGTVPEGETFGQTFDSEENGTNAEDHFEVIADQTNNPQASINAGERNYNAHITYPAPAGSIKIGVGILMKS